MNAFLRRYPRILAATLFAALAGALALLAGKDLNWDLFNYHYYNGWALLHQRAALDIAPAQLQSYFNPLLDVPLYLAIRHLPPWLVGLLYAGLQSLNCWLVWYSARRVLPRHVLGEWVALGLGLMTLTGAIFHSELGGGMGDTLVSLPLLAAVALLLTHASKLARLAWPRAALWLVLAGMCAGAAGGLKLVALIYALGFGLATAVLGLRPAQRLGFPLVFGGGALLGWLLLGGSWMWHLWQAFGNPLYPLFNSVFHSPLAPLAPLQDQRFLPSSWWQALVYPLYWLVHPRAVSDVGRFFDLRLPLLFVAAVVWLAQCMRRRGRMAFSPGAAFLLAGSGLSYVLWLGLFGVYRYLAPIELLAPLLLWLLLAALGLPMRVAVALLVLAALTVAPLRWGRGDWTADYFDTSLPATVTATESGLVLMGTTTPSGFLPPLLPEGLQFVRIASNFTGQPVEHGLDRRISATIAGYRGPLFALYNDADSVAMDAGLARHGLQRDTASCVSFDSAGKSTRPEPLLPLPFVWCRLRPN